MKHQGHPEREAREIEEVLAILVRADYCSLLIGELIGWHTHTYPHAGGAEINHQAQRMPHKYLLTFFLSWSTAQSSQTYYNQITGLSS